MNDDNTAGDPFADDDNTTGSPFASPPTSVLKRTLHGALDPLYGLAQGMDKLIVDPIRQRIAPGSPNMDTAIAEREAGYTPPEGIDWARMGGNIASPLTLATLPVQGISRGASAAVGATSAALEPSQATGMDYVKEKAKQAAAGGALGYVLPGLPKSKEARQLMALGVQPTVGQSLPGQAFNKLEQATTSWPIVGQTVANTRQRPLDEFEQQVFQRATGIKAKSIDEANAAVSNMYQSVAPHLPKHNLNDDFMAVWQKALQNPELTPVNQKLLYDLTGNRFANYEQLSGAQLKNLDSDIGALIRKYSRSTDVSHHAIADGLQEIQRTMRATWEKLLPPNLQGKLQQANQAYARMVPVNRAASTRGDERIMPRALQKATARQSGMDASRMPPDNLVDPALKVLPGNLADSGTPARLLATDVDTLVKAAIAKIPAELLYSRPMQRVLTGNTPWQARHGAALSATTSAALRNRQKKEQDDGR